MSVYNWIKENIWYNSQSGYYDQKTETEVGGQASTWEKIKDQDINYIIWYGVAEGGGFDNDEFNGKTNSYGVVYKFGGPNASSFNPDTGWGFEGINVTEEDADFLLTGDNGKPWSQILEAPEVFVDAKYVKYIWGNSFADERYGVVGAIRQYDFANENLPNGITDGQEVELAKSFLKLVSRNSDSFSSAPGFPTINVNVDYAKRNLVKNTKDVADLYHNIQDTFYDYTTFIKKVSIATSMYLEYGVPITTEPHLSFQLDEGDMTLKNITGAGGGQGPGGIQQDEKTIGDTKFTGGLDVTDGVEVSYPSNTSGNQTQMEKFLVSIWKAKEEQGKLYPAQDKTFALGFGLNLVTIFFGNRQFINNLWLPQIPSFEESDRVYEISDNLDSTDRAIIKFLTGERIEYLYNTAIANTILDPILIKDDPIYSLSNRKPNGEPKNLLEYDAAGQLWDTYRQNKISLDKVLFEKYMEFSIAIESGNVEPALDQTGNQVPVPDSPGDVYASLSKTIDKIAFEAALIVSQIIAINKVNLIKAGMFVSLDELEEASGGEEDLIDQALKGVASGLDSGANLGYEDDKLSKEEISDRQKLLEQCALLLNLKDLSNDYRDMLIKQRSNTTGGNVSPVHAYSFFKNRFFRINGTSDKQSKTLTSFHSPKGLAEPFVSIPPVLQALLVPKIRLQKVINKGDRTYTIDIPFTQVTTEVNSLTPIDYNTAFANSNDVFHGGAVGIKNMTFNFDGETPATAQKYVKGNLSLKFQDFKDLVVERETAYRDDQDKSGRTTFRYVDLIVNSPDPKIKNTTKKNLCKDGENSTQVESYLREFYNPTNYRIKADVGWSFQRDISTDSLINNLDGFDADSFYAAVEAQNKTFMLAALDHDLNINDDGSVDLNINYFGYPDALLSSYKFNALISNATESQVQKELQELLCTISTGICTQTQLNKLQGAIEKKREQRLKDSMQNLLKRLTANRLIRYMKINDSDQLKTFRTIGSFTKKPTIETDLGETPLRGADEVKPFIFLGDLFYVLLDCMYDNGGAKVEGTENIVPILTDFTFSEYLGRDDENPPDNPKVTINIAEIPIALSVFKEWYTDEIIASEKYVYPVMEFILVLCNKLIGDVLTEVCFNKKSDKMLYFRQATLHGDMSKIQDLRNAQEIDYESEGGVIGTSLLEQTNVLPFTVSESNLDYAHKIANYVVLYADTKLEYHMGKGDYVQDMEDGIYHFFIGSDKGLVKKINFSKTNITYLRESRMYRYQGIGDFVQLSNVYNVSLDMFGNFMFFPGMQIFIDPFAIGGETFGEPENQLINNNTINFAKLMGIGGYHLIKNVQVSIGVDGFKTSIDAIFVFSGDSTGNGNGVDGVIRLEEPTVPINLAADGTNSQACDAILSEQEGIVIPNGGG